MTDQYPDRQGAHWSRGLRSLALALSLVVLALFACAAAQAAPTWLPPADLSTASVNSPPAVAVDALGNVVAVWTRQHGDNNSNYIVQAATRPAGGSWSAPENLSAVGGADPKPRVAVDPEGTAVAIWVQDTGESTRTVQAVSRAPGDSWSTPANLSAPLPYAAWAKVALDSQGRATAVWSNGGAMQARDRSATGEWSPPQTVATDGNGLNIIALDLALNSKGDATAVWYRTSGTNSTVQAVSRPAGGSWSSASEDLSSPLELQYAENPQVAVGPGGEAAVVWDSYYVHASTVFAVTRTADGAWSAPEVISGVGQFSRFAQVAIDAKGSAIAIWDRYDGSNSVNRTVREANRPAGGSWSAPQDLAPVGRGSTAQLTVDLSGEAVGAAWTRFINSKDVVQVVTRPPGTTTWSAPRSASDPTQSAFGASVALDPQGNAVAGWSGSSGTDRIAQAAGYDAAGPQLRNVTVPAAGTVGSPLSFSVSPVDVWSPVASTNWDLGDGTGATGPSPSHTYAAAGTYQVAVTSADSLGNSSSTTKRNVTVTSPRTDGTSTPVGTGTATPTTPGSGGAPSGGPRGGAAPTSERSALRGCLTRAKRELTRQKRRGARKRCTLPGHPARVRARADSSSEIILSFLAPGSVGRSGPPARRYVIKQSTRPIRSERGFRRALTLCRRTCAFKPQRRGQRLSLRITGLRSKRTYYYAVKAVGVGRRTGPRSRTVRATTR